jgi:Na+/melibiose symporter-like transporter
LFRPGLLRDGIGMSTRDTMQFLALTVVVLLLVSFGVMLFVVEEPKAAGGSGPGGSGHAPLSPLVSELRRAWCVDQRSIDRSAAFKSSLVPTYRRNRPFMILLTAHGLSKIAYHTGQLALPFFVTYVLREENDMMFVSLCLLVGSLATFASIPVWTYFINKR